MNQMNTLNKFQSWYQTFVRWCLKTPFEWRRNGKVTILPDFFYSGEPALPGFPVPPDFFGSKIEWMFGSTPPLAIVTCPSSLLSSSSFLTASWMWRGTILVFLLSRDAFPANSSTWENQIETERLISTRKRKPLRRIKNSVQPTSLQPRQSSTLSIF